MIGDERSIDRATRPARQPGTRCSVKSQFDDLQHSEVSAASLKGGAPASIQNRTAVSPDGPPVSRRAWSTSAGATFGSSLLPLPGVERTLPVLLKRRAEIHPDKPVLRMDGQAWSATGLIDIAARRAGALQDAGLMRGDRLAWLCSNRFELFELVLACGWLGAIAVPINIASRGLQLQHILANSGAKVLAVETGLLSGLATLDFAQLQLQSLW